MEQSGISCNKSEQAGTSQENDLEQKGSGTT